MRRSVLAVVAVGSGGGGFTADFRTGAGVDIVFVVLAGRIVAAAIVVCGFQIGPWMVMDGMGWPKGTAMTHWLSRDFYTFVFVSNLQKTVAFDEKSEGVLSEMCSYGASCCLEFPLLACSMSRSNRHSTVCPSPIIPNMAVNACWICFS